VGRKDKGVSIALGLAMMGVVLLVWPHEIAVMAAVMTLLIHVGRDASSWMAKNLPRWARILMVAVSTSAVASVYAFVPLGDNFVHVVARATGTVALLGHAWIAALWEFLPDRITGGSDFD
jgi:ABC-type uncharacterized transport system permease subunit